MFLLLSWMGSGAEGGKIVDSIMACFRVDYCGRGELSEWVTQVTSAIAEAEIWRRRQQKLGQMLSKLSHMSEGS